jgi:integrase
MMLQLLKETAMRIGEAWSLEWIDIDFERKIIRLNTLEKHSDSRAFNVSGKLIDMLGKIPRKSNRIFGYINLQCYNHTFLLLRKRLAQTLQNPRILQITFHTFRHWKAAMLYHQTKDPLYVMQLLGHRDINNTLRYIQIEKTLFNSGNDEFHVKVAKP